MPQCSLAAIVRYPVKSMEGEGLSSADLVPGGLSLDRLYAFESPKAPPGMLRVSSAERRQLLRYRATGASVVTPDGASLPIPSPELLSHLRSELSSPALTLTHAATPQTDCRPLSLISLQTVQQLSLELGSPIDIRRFRANLVLDLPGLPGFSEDIFIGQGISIGQSATLRALERDPRCRFITFDPAAPDSVPDTTLLNHLHRHHQSRAGIYAAVLTPGPIRVGDIVRVHEKAPGITGALNV